MPQPGLGAALCRLAMAYAAAGQVIDRGVEVDLATGLEIERMAFASLFATDDQKIGMGLRRQREADLHRPLSPRHTRPARVVVEEGCPPGMVVIVTPPSVRFGPADLRGWAGSFAPTSGEGRGTHEYRH